MAITRSLIEFVHDEGYGDDLVKHINIALRGKDMLAEMVVTSAIVVPVELAARLRERVRHIGSPSEPDTVNIYGIRVYEADPEDCARLAQELTDAGEKVLLVLSQDAPAT